MWVGRQRTKHDSYLENCNLFSSHHLIDLFFQMANLYIAYMTPLAVERLFQPLQILVVDQVSSVKNGIALPPPLRCRLHIVWKLSQALRDF